MTRRKGITRAGLGSLWRRLARERRGAVLAEFAMAFPILIVLTIGGFELGRFVLLQQKLQSVAVETADLVAQAETVTAGDVDNILLAVDHIMTPFDLGDKGVVIITSIGATGTNPPKVNWQRSGGGTATATSRLGAPGENAILPAGFVVRAGESVIISEVFYNFEPLFATNLVPLPTTQLYNESFYRPRFGTLTALN